MQKPNKSGALYHPGVVLPGTDAVLDREGKVVYASKDGKSIKVFPAMEWLAAMCSHIPNRGEQMVRYYGYYSNVVRGKRQQEGIDDAIPCILEPQGNEKAFRKNLARLIQKIYEVNPPGLSEACPREGGDVRGSCGSSVSLRTRR